MNGSEMIVAIVAIGCGTGVVVSFISMLRAGISGRTNREQQALSEEVRALRGEMQTLRAQHNDLLLNVDTTLQRVERRLMAGEARPLTPEVSETRQVVNR
jgi:hypothetical protein